MKLWIALAAAGMISVAAPALAQEAGQAGAAGESSATTGHNPPGTAGVTSGDMGRHMGTHHRRHHTHHHRHHHHHRM